MKRIYKSFSISIINIFILSLLIIHPVSASDKFLIAVAPFGGKPVFKALLIGFQGLILYDLQVLTGNKVVKRETVNRYLSGISSFHEFQGIYVKDARELAGKLNADYIVMGRFYENDGKIKINIKLYDSHKEKVVETFDVNGTLGQLTAMKNEVVFYIIQKLEINDPGKTMEYLTSGAELPPSAILQYSKGLEALDRKDYIASVKYFQEVHKKYPNFRQVKNRCDLLRKKIETDISDLSKIGMLNFIKGDMPAAHKYFTMAVSSDPDNVPALVGLGKVYFHDNKMKEAEKSFSRALKLSQDDPEAQMNLGKIHKIKGDLTNAKTYFEKSVKIEPNNAYIHEQLGEIYGKEKNNKPAANEYIKAAKLHGKNLEIERAVTNLELAGKLVPQSALPSEIEGDLYRMIGQPENAEQAYKKTIDMSPDDDGIYGKMGDTCLDTGDVKQARQMFIKSLELNPLNLDANLGMAHMEKEEGKDYDALPYYRKAAEAAPKNKRALLGLARICKHAGNKKELLGRYEKLKDLYPEDAVIHKEMGDAFFDADNIKGASSQYQEAIRLDPDYSDAYKQLGITQKRSGHLKEARLSFQKAKMIDPNINVPYMQSEDFSDNTKKIYLDLIRSFPAQEFADKLALIEIGQDIDKSGGVDILKYLKLHRLSLNKVRKEIRFAMLRDHNILNKKTLHAVLSRSPFDAMSSEDITNTEYLEYLCDKSGVRTLVFYKISDITPEESEAYKFKITVILFNQLSGKRWENSAIISYEKEELDLFNLPLAIIIWLIILSAIVCIIRYIMKGSGDIHAVIEKDPKSHAVFSLTLSKNANKNFTRIKNRLDKAKKFNRKAKFGTKYEKFMVTKDAGFENIHAGDYYLYLYGIMKSNVGMDQIGNYQLAEKVTVKKGEVSDVIFNLMPTESLVEVLVYDKSEIAEGAEVSIKGMSASKFIKEDGMVFFNLPIGNYTLQVNYNDKSYSEDISIDKIEDYSFTVSF